MNMQIQKKVEAVGTLGSVVNRTAPASSKCVFNFTLSTQAQQNTAQVYKLPILNSWLKRHPDIPMVQKEMGLDKGITPPPTFIYLFIYMHSFTCAVSSVVKTSGGYFLLPCVGFLLWWLLLLRSRSSRCPGSVVVTYGLSCFEACRIFLNPGSNQYSLHWHADSYSLHYKGTTVFQSLNMFYEYYF